VKADKFTNNSILKGDINAPFFVEIFNKWRKTNMDMTTDSEQYNLMRGAFVVSRSIDQSEVWFKDHIYLKGWIWMIGKANHKTIEKEGFVYMRGELLTTYEEIRESLRIYRHNKKIYPTLKQVRVMLDWFVTRKMIEKTAVKKEEAPPFSYSSPTQNAISEAGNKAYIGLRIRIINYDTYQNLGNYEGRHKGEGKGSKKAEQGRYNNKETTRKKKERKKYQKPPLPDYILCLVRKFNLLCPNLPKVKELTESRIANIARARNEFFDVQWWERVFKKANRIRIEGDTVWTPRFDWLTEDPTNAARDAEGAYENNEIPE